jgi:hypothetical protein
MVSVCAALSQRLRDDLDCGTSQLLPPLLEEVEAGPAHNVIMHLLVRALDQPETKALLRLCPKQDALDLHMRLQNAVELGSGGMGKVWHFLHGCNVCKCCAPPLSPPDSAPSAYLPGEPSLIGTARIHTASPHARVDGTGLLQVVSIRDSAGNERAYKLPKGLDRSDLQCEARIVAVLAQQPHTNVMPGVPIVASISGHAEAISMAIAVGTVGDLMEYVFDNNWKAPSQRALATQIFRQARAWRANLPFRCPHLCWHTMTLPLARPDQQ